MSLAAAHPDIAAIDAALAKGEWWVRLFDELARVANRRAKSLDVNNPKTLWQVAVDLERFTRALCLAVLAATCLEGFLSGLAELSKLSPGDLAAARARAKAKADAEAAARATARDKARVLREARKAEIRARVMDVIEREKPAHQDREPLIEALERRLAVDPALVDVDDLPLRETVTRICAELGITPDWRRWEAGDWTTIDPPAGAAPAQIVSAPPPKSTPALCILAPAPKVVASTVLQDVSRRLARRTDTAISLVLQAGPFAPPWLPPRPG
jgi:hypothetical protein